MMRTCIFLLALLALRVTTTPSYPLIDTPAAHGIPFSLMALSLAGFGATDDAGVRPLSFLPPFALLYHSLFFFPLENCGYMAAPRCWHTLAFGSRLHPPQRLCVQPLCCLSGFRLPWDTC
ncbi:hypothetical protein DFH06DRAFT_629337 [Mycena polygramma]|nr:hypothetical protein DFH06DRAFT_629337 [Mycena polygramma]